ncbi:type I restriction enzyme, R subunit [Persephonella hydrogeniphila]|uniref:Type I restriction enzyme endonuclease subunit n=1 Tax=Persephonella hydrogeniphila TaxID=198703 RepID=A0A285NDF3_9AQUI|nr:HsdR family type I site-specific deoxyribonuclease [Persephonella hydrogeniphila]SNZ06987.1 type I restriction enzyme, R subunit [Persephonella hydrogeniphila]
MGREFTEVEKPFLDQLESIGWEVIRLDDKTKDDPTKSFRESFKEIILENKFKEAIKNINPWIENDQIIQVLDKIQSFTPKSISEVNQEFTELLLEGIVIDENRKTGEKSPTVYLIDFKNPENNIFTAINQFKVNIPATEKHIIPDIVLFINGIPMILVEAKYIGASKEETPLDDAFFQIQRYMNKTGEGNEKLFWYNLFNVITTGETAKYGSITAQKEHYLEWKDPYPYKLSEIKANSKRVNSQNILIQGMLTKENLIDIIHNFILFKTENEKLIKIVPRYQQFRAVNKLIKKLKSSSLSNDKKGGIIWHTQGSGKSLTMMYIVRKAYHDDYLRGFKIVFITDRKDLEKQLYQTSQSVGFTVHKADTIEKLKNLLKTDTPDLVMGMIHKYQEKQLETEFPELNRSEKILVLIDEAHRTQYKTLGANLRKALPNSIKVAFTGTPIDKTEQTFGEYIDKYGMKEAVEDGVIVEIVYEGRTSDTDILDEEEIDKRFQDIFSIVNENERKKIAKKYTWKAYLEAKPVIEAKAKDMVNHYIEHVFPNGFKAQVVSVSRVAAVRYYKAIKKALEEIIKKIGEIQSEFEITEEKGMYKISKKGKELFQIVSPTELYNAGRERNLTEKEIKELKLLFLKHLKLDLLKNLDVAVVISGGDGNDYIKHFKDEISKEEYERFTNPKQHEQSISNFKKPFEKGGNIGFIIVQNMLLTGFDAPIEQVLYMDNVLKAHNLLQAIARVNRVYKNKFAGFVVDYVGIAKHLKEALSNFYRKDIDEITQVVVNKSKAIDELKFVFNQINEFFSELGIKNWEKGIFDKDIKEDVLEELADEDTRERFKELLRQFNRAIDKVLPDPQALKYIKYLKALNLYNAEARNIYRETTGTLNLSDKLRAVVDEYLISNGINPKIPPVSIMSEDFIKNLKRYKSPKLKAKELEAGITEYIKTHYEEDPELFERFSQLLRKIIQEYENNWEEQAKELEILLNQIKKGRETEETYGLDPKTEMPFLGLLRKEIYPYKNIKDLEESEREKLIQITKDILELVKRELERPDFWENITAQKRLKSTIIREFILKEFRDKPEIIKNRNAIVQKILELAYHLKDRLKDED